jgi:dUTP pyrophosphatase
MELGFVKLYDVKTPVRGTDKSAGLDFFIPEYTEEFSNRLLKANSTVKNAGYYFCNETFIRLGEASRILIPSGIKVKIPENHVLIAFNKSGVATKLGLDVGACVIDEDYQGEIHISLFNHSEKEVFLTYGQKILQFVLLPVVYPELLEYFSETDLYYDTESERGAGGFGSTGG